MPQSPTTSQPLSQLQLARLDRRSPLREQIYQLVRTLIIIGQISPRSSVNEIEIAAQLGVSRTPVREAVKRLSDEGLVDVYAQNGTFISPISRKAVEEAYIIRNALELESASRAAAIMTFQHGEALDDIVAAHETAITRKRYADAIRLDDEFHRYIAGINGLSMLWRAVDISKAQMDRARHLAIPRPGWGAQTIRQHRAIIEVLKSQNPSAAAAAMHEHLSSTLENTLSLPEVEELP